MIIQNSPSHSRKKYREKFEIFLLVEIKEKKKKQNIIVLDGGVLFWGVIVCMSQPALSEKMHNRRFLSPI